MENSFGSFLKQKRQEKQLTQKELAKILFVSESTISKWEKCVAHPDITLLPKISQVLGVSEHELITASVDYKAREERVQAKKWRVLSFSWSLFFYIAYSVALIPCFICNLAIDKTLSWFWIVLSALILSFTFTNLPKLIKKNKLILLPLIEYLALVLLLGICAIYTGGTWFFIPVIAVLLGLCIIFAPIYIIKYKAFEKIRKCCDFVTVCLAFLVLNLLLIVINFYTVKKNSLGDWWYLDTALPIACICFFILNLFLSVRFLRTNRFIKTSVILFLINVLYIVLTAVKVSNIALQTELDQLNIFKANFSNWQAEVALENNVHLIIFLTTLLFATVFLVVGIVRHAKKDKKHTQSKND